METNQILTTEHIDIGINDKVIVHDLSIGIPKGKITAIIGPNGCGKSTTLKAISRIWPVMKGEVKFDGKNIQKYSHREMASKLAILTQSPLAPSDITVKDLVSMGRFPHHDFWGRGGEDDAEHVAWALEQTSLTNMAERILPTMSGGERQRAWIAMALAQRPQVLLLDEPTTYLDICHQLEVMQLLLRLNRELGLTIAMVIHDLNHALMFADYVIVMKDGHYVTSGVPREILNADLLADVFHVKADEVIASDGSMALLPVDLYK